MIEALYKCALCFNGLISDGDEWGEESQKEGNFVLEYLWAEIPLISVHMHFTLAIKCNNYIGIA